MERIKKVMLVGVFFALLQVPVYATNQNLQYFGYLQTQGLPIPGSYNYLPEIGQLENSNVQQVYAELYPPTMHQYLDDVKAIHSKAFIAVQWIFVQDIVSINSKPKAVLYSNWQERWSTFVSIIETRESDIYAIMFDEPITSLGITEQDFRTITQKIRQDLPTLNTMVIEGYTPFINGEVPSSYIEFISDYGVDVYYSQNNAPLSPTTWEQFMTTYASMKRTAQNKRIWIIAEGYTLSFSNIQSLINAFNNYVNLANTDTAVVGILNFPYSKNTSQDQGLGVTLHDFFDPTNTNYSPMLKNLHSTTGKMILQNTSSTPTTTHTPRTQHPPCGEITSGSNKINTMALITFISRINTSCASSSASIRANDTNSDGLLSILDLQIHLAHYGL